MASWLLDTCTLLWATGEPDRLSRRAGEILRGPGNRILVSHASLWEMSIKVTVGKLVVPDGYFDALEGLGYEFLPTRPEHFAAYRRLPLRHRDPFDRLLVAQAQVEGFVLLSSDGALAAYEVDVEW